MTITRHIESPEWAPIDTAPHNEDVYLLVTDGVGKPYCLAQPWKLTAQGWVGAGKGAELVVRPLAWRWNSYFKRKRGVYEFRRSTRTD
jgi:hypothetical protein